MNAMSCNRCGKPVNAVSAFCPHCGQPLRQAAPQATSVASATLGATALQQAYDVQKKRNLVIGASVVFVAILLALILKASGLLGISGSNPKEKILNSNGSIGSPVMARGSGMAPPVMGQLGQKPPDNKMPDDVYAWLKHLEKCEALKIELTGQQETELSLVMVKMQALGAGMGLEDPYDQSQSGTGDKDPGSFAAGKMEDLRPKWNELLTFYRSLPPPQECVPIADDFDRALREIPARTGDIAAIMNDVMTDPQNALAKVEKMKNKSYNSIDKFFISCDHRVGEICMKYKVPKWFNIKADINTGELSKFSGMPTGN